MGAPKKILILAANPAGTMRLRLDEEVREIKEGPLRSKRRDEFIIEQREAVRIRDLRRALLDVKPQIVHFSGHGHTPGIVLEDESGQAIVVEPEALAGLFELFVQRVECVFLNACYSEAQATAINRWVKYVVGMVKEISDRAAIEFAVGFYDALGAGKAYEKTFQMEEQNLIPRKPMAREVESVKRPGKSKFAGLHKPRPIEKRPVAWLLETMK